MTSRFVKMLARLITGKDDSKREFKGTLRLSF